MRQVFKTILDAEKWQLALTLLVMLVAGLFLPASFIYWAVVISGVLGFISLWLYLLWKSGQNGVLSFIVALILLVPVGLVFGLYFGLLLIAVIPLLIAMLWPSAINLVASYLAVSLLPFSGIPKALWFVGISALLGFNVVLPALVQDVFIPQTGEMRITRVLNLPPGEFLSVETNIQKISFHAAKHSEILDLGANEGCGCAYWQTPRLMEEDIERVLQQEGLRYKIDKVSSGKNRLVVKAVDQFGITKVDFSLYQDNDKVASYQRQLRNHYPLEPWSGENASPSSRDLDDFDMRIYFLAQSNVWNFLASLPNRMQKKVVHSRDAAEESYYPVSYFLQHSISKNAPDRPAGVAHDLELKSEVRTAENSNWPNEIKESIIETTSACQIQKHEAGMVVYSRKPGYSLSVLYQSLLFEFDSKKLFVAPGGLGTGVIFCTDLTYKVISHPGNQGYFFVSEYSIDGNLLASEKVSLPDGLFKGQYRRIEKFGNSKDIYMFDVWDMGEDQRPLRAYEIVARRSR